MDQATFLAAIQLMWTCYTHPPIYSQRTATTPGTSSPTLLEWCVGSLTSHRELTNMEDICETGPTVYRPYPRRLESLTICGCNYKLKAALFPQLFKDLGPVPQKPINANLRLKINQAVYFSIPKCCSTQIFGRTLHEKTSILKNKNKQKKLSPKS